MAAHPDGDHRAVTAARSVLDRLPPQPAAVLRTAARRALGRTPPPPSTRLVVPGPDAGTVDPGATGATCPMCGTDAAAFLPYGVKAPRPDCRCPGCNSLERHRLVWLFFALHTDLLTGPAGGPTGADPSVVMLHVAPEPPMTDRLVQLPHVRYLSVDLEPGKAMAVMDITNIDRPDGTFDVIYASHVLEHIPDDVRAMRELRRVLKPDGWAVLEVPIHGATTREDPSVTSPAERARLFGQHDHVRMYGRDGEYERRLRSAGFDVTVVPLADQLGEAAIRRYRLRSGEDVYLCRPGAASS